MFSYGSEELKNDFKNSGGIGDLVKKLGKILDSIESYSQDHDFKEENREWSVRKNSKYVFRGLLDSLIVLLAEGTGINRRKRRAIIESGAEPSRHRHK